MPRCAAFVDELREAFGAAEINDVIKRGLRPECDPKHRVRFSEAGYVLGLPTLDVGGLTVAQMVIGEQMVSAKVAKRGGR